jgi:Toprim domain
VKNSWRRVSRRERCPICGRGDWCLISADGAAVICPRTESARRPGEAGWLHRLHDNNFIPGRRTRTLTLTDTTRRQDLDRLADEFCRAVHAAHLDQFASALGVTVDSLRRLRIGWYDDRRSWSFPMVTVDGAVLGIRLRGPDGSKFAVKGGKEGLFIPMADEAQPCALVVVEGATDTAALLDMGFVNVVGRPSCTGGIKLVVEVARRRQPPEVVVVADNDEPGRRGADNLASVLVAYAPVRVIAPPEGIKDVREWLRAGGTREDVERAIDAADVRRLKVTSLSRE